MREGGQEDERKERDLGSERQNLCVVVTLLTKKSPTFYFLVNIPSFS